MIWLLGIGSWLKEAAGAALGWIVRWPWQFALIAALLVCGWLWHGRNEARDELAAIHAAQKQATAAQAAVNHEPARKSQAIAEKSDAEAPAYYADVRRAAADNSVRVRDPRPISGPDLPGADRSEPGIHGPDPAADLVCRPEVEDGQLVNAASRAAEMHQEALDLIDAGVAVAGLKSSIPD